MPTTALVNEAFFTSQNIDQRITQTNSQSDKWN